MDTFTLYLLLTLPQVGKFLTFIAISGSFGLFVTLVVGIMEGVFYRIKSLFFWGVGAVLLCGLLSAAIPDKQSMLILAGNEVVNAVTNSEIGQDVVKLLHNRIKEELRGK